MNVSKYELVGKMMPGVKSCEDYSENRKGYLLQVTHRCCVLHTNSCVKFELPIFFDGSIPAKLIHALSGRSVS